MKNVIVVIALIVLASCKETKKSESLPAVETIEIEISKAARPHLGKKIMETECYICHDPKAAETSMIAPPMIAIKKYYIGEKTTKKEFTESLMLWINDPEAPSKMLRAQEKFGKMPYLPYPEETVTMIAEYLYDNEIEKPKWFDAHFEEEHDSDMVLGKHENQDSQNAEISNRDIGLGYALTAKAILGKNLMKAINEKGTIAAIIFCNTKAMKLTDSMSVMKNAIIKRVSDKPRNPKNKANDEEIGYINYFKKAVASGVGIEPIVKPKNDEVDFYYPITTNTMCLQCHGKPNEQIQLETLETLKSLYPSDKAIGYDINEVRGLWAISFVNGNAE